MRRVRTPEGARFYQAPIGTPIVKDKYTGKMRALKAVAPAPVKVPAAPVSKSFLRKLVAAGKQGGFTADLRQQSFKKDGFAVSRPGTGQHFSVNDDDADARIEAYIDQHWDALSTDPEVYLGGWVDDETGEIWLDITEVSDSEDTAYERAKQRGEIAIASLAKYAAGEDGEVRIKYESRPPVGTPAHDNWMDTQGKIHTYD